ncbi:hypothetical protein BY458DRAFT_487671 [Sporodiniella umbellata]|nr:hypothetical protein BY458DRAFT_487671 [Sporodiniella umbellata]
MKTGRLLYSNAFQNSLPSINPISHNLTKAVSSSLEESICNIRTIYSFISNIEFYITQSRIKNVYKDTGMASVLLRSENKLANFTQQQECHFSSYQSSRQSDPTPNSYRLIITLEIGPHYPSPKTNQPKSHWDLQKNKSKIPSRQYTRFLLEIVKDNKQHWILNIYRGHKTMSIILTERPNALVQNIKLWTIVEPVDIHKNSKVTA